jgi:hypothetical protein
MIFFNVICPSVFCSKPPVERTLEGMRRAASLAQGMSVSHQEWLQVTWEGMAFLHQWRQVGDINGKSPLGFQSKSLKSARKKRAKPPMKSACI